MVGEAKDELLMLGADAPFGARLLAGGEYRNQIVTIGDRELILGGRCARTHGGRQ
jgi:hypothetical protein